MTEPHARNGSDAVSAGWPAELSGEYEFLAELGKGGMAVVYRARERALGREVAIKVVRPRFHSDEESVARLAREARTVAQLEHPNIVSLHAIKRLQNGLALVMQLVPGETLKGLLSKGPLSIERADAILRDVARALAYAHRCGVIHRDVKPENIFLDSITGRALLSDFGVARSITDSTELTATGTAIGTPSYMSPEQIDGGSLDGRTDLYALGIVAWESLSGQRPWAGESLYSVIYRQKHDALPPLDAMREDIPPRMQFLIEGLMYKRADQRLPSAATFLSLLAGTEKLPGFKEWQVAVKKRRKTGAHKAITAVNPQSVSPASSTVQYRRGEVGTDGTPGSENRVSLSTPSRQSAAPTVASPWGADAVFDKSGWFSPRRLGLAVLAVFAAAAGIFALSRPDARPRALNRDSLQISDASGIAVPVIRDTNTATGTIDSFAGGGVTDIAVADSVTAPPTGVSVTVPSPTVASPTKASDSLALKPPVVAVTPVVDRQAPPTIDTATIPAEPSLAFPAERGTVAAGVRHSCGIAANGRALCWGNNEGGQLGDGSLTASEQPVPVAGDFSYAFVSAGNAHTCGTSRDGDAYCWGTNTSGQLGDGTRASRSAPVRVSGSVTYRRVYAGQSHSCGISSSGNVFCWGSNSSGQLGDGSTASRATPARVQLNGSAATLSVGNAHTCALLLTGDAYCWGRNDAGQLGDGSSTNRSTPTAVTTSQRFVSIATGSAHSCAVTVDGDAQCWGSNRYGQLGSGTTSASNTPVRVDAAGPFATISVGTSHSCARTRDQRGFCWGRNVYGQLGDGTTEDRTRPASVKQPGVFSALNANGAHTCGVSGSETYCWGYNVDGQLGVGDRESVSAPAKIIGERQ